MDQPSPSPGSTVGHSLVGTLIAVGLFLVMVTVGISLMTATEAQHVPAAELQLDEIEARECPADVRAEAEIPAARACMNLTLHNVGDAEGIARCEITGEPAGAEARFEASGFHVNSTEIPGGGVRPLLIRVDGAGKAADQIAVTCDLVPPPKG